MRTRVPTPQHQASAGLGAQPNQRSARRFDTCQVSRQPCGCVAAHRRQGHTFQHQSTSADHSLIGHLSTAFEIIGQKQRIRRHANPRQSKPRRRWGKRDHGSADHPPTLDRCAVPADPSGRHIFCVRIRCTGRQDGAFKLLSLISHHINIATLAQVRQPAPYPSSIAGSGTISTPSAVSASLAALATATELGSSP